MKVAVKILFVLMLTTIILRWPAHARAGCTEEYEQLYAQLCDTTCNDNCSATINACVTSCESQYMSPQNPNYNGFEACANLCSVGVGECESSCVPECINGYCGN